MSLTINDLNELPVPYENAVVHVMYGGFDYKLPIASFSHASKFVFASVSLEPGTNNFVATLNPPLTEYNESKVYVITFLDAPTADGFTINIDGVGAIPEKKQAHPLARVAMNQGDVPQGVTLMFRYDGAESAFVLAGPIGEAWFSKSITISSADFLLMDEPNCVDLTETPPTGYAIEVMNIIFKLKWESGNTQYIGGGDIIVNSSSNGTNPQYYLASTQYTGNAVALYHFIREDSEPFFEGEPLRAFIPSLLPSGGDSDVCISISYRLVKL